MGGPKMFRRNKQIKTAKKLNAYGLPLMDESKLYDEVVSSMSAIMVKELGAYLKHNPGTEIELSNIRLK
jgi:hypothetical protein